MHGLSYFLHRTIYWSDIGSNPLKIRKASMDGSHITTAVLLNTNVINTFVFTLDYSQQMLYWMNSSDNCHHTNYLESSRVDGSGRSIAYDPSRNHFGCYYGYYRGTQAIDFFGGAIYSFSRRHFQIIKTEMNHPLNNIITNFASVGGYMCQSLYLGMKVISSERQRPGIHILATTSMHGSPHYFSKTCTLLGINPCAINNGGCAHLCLLSNTDQRYYTCACHSGTQLDQNGHDCNYGKTCSIANDCLQDVGIECIHVNIV